MLMMVMFEHVHLQNQAVFFEVCPLAFGADPKASYVVRSFADAQCVTAKLRWMLQTEAAASKKAGVAPAVEDIRRISSRSLRSGCGTALKDLPPDIRMGQLDHSSLEVRCCE